MSLFDTLKALFNFSSEQSQYQSSHMLEYIREAIRMMNPHISVLDNVEEVIAGAVRTSVQYIQVALELAPNIIDISPNKWSDSPELRSFFASSSDVTKIINRSVHLKQFFTDHPSIQEAIVVLGMRFDSKLAENFSLSSNESNAYHEECYAVFSDHQIRICSANIEGIKSKLTHKAFEYLVAQALYEVSDERQERIELTKEKALIQARLRLLRQSSHDLSDSLSFPEQEPIVDKWRQHELEKQLIENDMELSGAGGEEILRQELNELNRVLLEPHKYFQVQAKSLKVDSMNRILTDREVTNNGYNPIQFSQVTLMGNPSIRRSFVLGRVGREFAKNETMDLDKAGYSL